MSDKKSISQLTSNITGNTNPQIQRLNFFIKKTGERSAAIAEKLGVLGSAFSMMRKRNSNIPMQTVILLEKCYRLNREWLLNGEGPMFLKRKAEPDADNAPDPEKESLDQLEKGKN